MQTETTPLANLSQAPLLEALFGRRARRFGLGMEIPSGPLAFKSRSEPLPLDELEQSMLLAAATGVTGWSFGIPFSPARPDQHASATQRFTGRTAPTAAGIGTPALLYTDDDGTYFVNTRDVVPAAMRMAADGYDPAEQIMAVCRERTVRLSSQRLDLPRAGGHMLEPNLWMANAPGSTLFMPIADASEEALGLLAIFVAHGYLLMDPDARRPAGDLERFVRSGLLSESKPFPLPVLLQATYESNCSEVAFMAHNIVLTMQAMGLGGLYFNGLNRWTVMGAFAADGIKGLGFRFRSDERWVVPDPVGLDGLYEGMCPPYHEDMRAAARAFVERKFGEGGTYDPATPGPWKDASRVKGSVEPYSEEFIECVAEIAQYVYDKHGRFPGTFTTIVLPGFVQAQHIDTEYYDTHYQPGAYLPSHAEHMRVWHGG